jgi:glyoxylase-like metal-dependent hydrolase (beta-lactamase superfamily II)
MNTWPSARRDFLKTLLGSAAGVAVFHAQIGEAAVKSGGTSIAATRLSDTLELVTGSGGNVLLLRTADGVLQVDGGDAQHSKELLKLVDAKSDARRVQVLINTHWHPEQTGSNALLGKAGTKIIAHENTKLWLGTEVDLKWQGKVYPPQPREALPTETIYTKAKLVFGNETVEYGYLPQAHTDGDLYVFLPNQNVLVTGDVMAVGSYPILDWCTGGWISGMVNANKALLDMTDANTRIVPGLGPVQTRADLQAQHEMLSTMRGRLIDLLKKGMSVNDMIAQNPSREFDAKWGDPKLLIANAYPGMIGHVRELGGGIL